MKTIIALISFGLLSCYGSYYSNDESAYQPRATYRGGSQGNTTWQPAKKKREECYYCNGEGYSNQDCTICHGSGRACGQKCFECKGHGFQVCWNCKGKGYTERY